MYKEGIQLIVDSKSKTFFSFCFCFLLGILLGSLFDNQLMKWDFLSVYVSFFVLSTFLVLVWKRRHVRFFTICILFVFIGGARYMLTFPSEHNIVALAGSQAQFTGFVSVEPDVREDGVRYIVRLLPQQEGSGKVYIKNTLYPQYSYGDVLEVSCLLQKPTPIENFRYDKYLEKFQIFTLCISPKIQKLEGKRGNIFMRSLLSLKKRVEENIEKLWPEPYASFMAGILYGYRGGLGKLADDFQRTGVTHIIAISGYNITIVASFLVTILTYLFIPRKKGFYIVLCMIGIFTLFAGASASVVRAAIMGMLILMAQQFGRLSHAGNALILAAALMCLQNPRVLLFDAGFQLSFLATLGLLYILPIFQKIFQNVPEYLGIKDITLGTLSATMITLPLIVYQFGRVSLVALPVNIFILPLIPVIMYLGFLVVFFSFFFMPIALILSFFTYMVMTYVVGVVKIFSKLPFASYEMSIPIWSVTFCYGIIFLFLYFHKKKLIK
ncbi:MAG: hypothetical protein COV59_01990 [Candidatus Magasanikbacteria bacterium CG11_big_fil_rev_8_21_14_0_20_39_34]|uniref:ComEC/Rec2-related protein domain-containing protein n=1 Tax=Candidatus Magasanikbacteria bacterium CG11_big_fil_rev_8_21_14_0_20_39_34 TaxID=1974653 RepID=A0A2H0N4W8_9BACT|nr:MAG: hypothetical protein COV59_01990 [Candidatus Magasanikbacteria bacterium CG11_big_fil_rev_8_21_14_0_20_39_34]